MRRWMAPVIVILLVLLAIGVVLSVFSAAVRPPEQVVVATGEWPPFIGSNLPDYGPLAELLREVLSREGYRPSFEFGSWSEAQDRAASGKVFGTLPFIKTAERELRFSFSEPLVSAEYVLFYKLPAFRQDGGDMERIADPEELSSYKVGLMEGYQLWGDLPNLVDVAETYDDLYEAFEALDRGEIDLLGESRVVGERILLTPGFRWDPEHFDHIDEAGSWLRGTKQEFHLLMKRSEKNEELLQDSINPALREVERTGVYEAIMTPLQLDPVAPERISLLSAPTPAKNPVNGRWYLLPRGTSAAVLAWPDAFRQGQSSLEGSNEPLWCRIKVLNGPQRGRVLMVEADQIELED